MRVITGIARGRKLVAPEGMDVRPTADKVKEGIFSAVQFELEGARVLDLFAGSGQMGIEALSRGASYGVFVDQSAEAVKVIKANLKKVKFDQKATVLQSDYLRYLSSCSEKFDIIFLDPPYAQSHLENALQKISEIDILSEGGIIICESRRETQLPEMRAPYRKRKEYHYGKVKLCLYCKEKPE